MTTLLGDQDPGPATPPAKYLETLVGEGKKFATPEDMAKGKWESDLYVKTLEEKLDQLNTDYRKLDTDYKSRASLEEIIDKMTQPKEPVSSDPPPAITQPQIDPNQLRSLVDQSIQQSRLQERQEANLEMIKGKLIERHGKDYQGKLTEQMQELNLSKDTLDNMAKTMPQVLIRTLGLDRQPTPEPFKAPVRTNVNFQPTGERKRNQSFYEQLRKENPVMYFDPKTTVQRHNDALALGEEFFDVTGVG